MYLLDVLVVIVYICHSAIVGIIYYCMRIGASVLRTGRGRAGGVEFLTEKKCSAKKCSWGPKTKKKKKKKIFGGGGAKNF